MQVFLSAHLPDARASLRPGASEADIQTLEAALGISMPLSLRVMYRWAGNGTASEFEFECKTLWFMSFCQSGFMFRLGFIMS